MGTFKTRKAASRARADAEAGATTNTRFDSKRGEIFFGEYARSYVTSGGGARGSLAPRTRDLYLELLGGVLAPWERVMLVDITTERVRTWRSETLTDFAEKAKVVQRNGAVRGLTGERRVEQGHSLMKAVLNMAVTEKKIQSNEALLPRLARVKRRVKPLMTITEVFSPGIAA